MQLTNRLGWRVGQTNQPCFISDEINGGEGIAFDQVFQHHAIVGMELYNSKPCLDKIIRIIEAYCWQWMVICKWIETTDVHPEGAG